MQHLTKLSACSKSLFGCRNRIKELRNATAVIPELVGFDESCRNRIKELRNATSSDGAMISIRVGALQK